MVKDRGSHEKTGECHRGLIKGATVVAMENTVRREKSLSKRCSNTEELMSRLENS